MNELDIEALPFAAKGLETLIFDVVRVLFKFAPLLVVDGPTKYSIIICADRPPFLPGSIDIIPISYSYPGCLWAL